MNECKWLSVCAIEHVRKCRSERVSKNVGARVLVNYAGSWSVHCIEYRHRHDM